MDRSLTYCMVWVKLLHRKSAHLVDGEAVAEERERAERHERDEQHERRLHRVQIGLSCADRIGSSRNSQLATAHRADSLFALTRVIANAESQMRGAALLLWPRRAQDVQTDELLPPPPRCF